MENIIDIASNIVEVLLIIIGAASIIVSGLKKIAELTPTDKDDKALATIEKFLGSVLIVLDRLALNPDKDHARESKSKKE
jgi:hypothetical protein